MDQTVDLVGFSLDSALDILSGFNNKVIIKETFGKTSTKSDNARVLRQLILDDDILQLTIAYF